MSPVMPVGEQRADAIRRTAASGLIAARGVTGVAENAQVGADSRQSPQSRKSQPEAVVRRD
jgi:hypothetical protein